MELSKKLSFDTIENEMNLADELEKEDLLQIAHACISEFKIDRDSRAQWDRNTKSALDIAKQIVGNKADLGRANVKYPLITISAIQFASRSYPEFIRNGRVVNCAVVGIDPTGQKEARARRVSDHMSWQMLQESGDWEQGFDRLLHVLPILGTVFKKTYYDPITKMNCSKLCLPDSIFVNQAVDSLESARRISHIVYQHKNELLELMRYGYYCDSEDIFKQNGSIGQISDLLNRQPTNNQDDDAYRPILEQHRWLDLDGDGYQEPYIVNVDLNSQRVLRIYKRFKPDMVDIRGNKICRIIPSHYFTDFHFVPAPDGTFMSYGYGQLLLPINETVNSTINQLLDAGTLSNRQAMLLSKEVRLKKGQVDIKPGEIITTECPAEYLAKGIYPLPVREPSNVLFELMSFMTDAGKQLASVTDVLQGEMPTQNSPATTVLSMVEQGLKVFSSLQKRIYRSLRLEFKKWYDLNAEFLSNEQYFRFEEDPRVVVKQDYQNNDFEISPVADPSLSSDAQRIARAQALMQSMPMLPAAGQKYALSLWLDALQFPQSQIMQLLPQSAPPPDPETIKTLAEADLIHAKAQDVALKAQIAQYQVAVQDKQADVMAQANQLKAAEMGINAKHQADALNLQAATAMVQAKQDEHKMISDHVNKQRELDIKEKVANKPTPKPAKGK